jgi:hypothetical protein
MPGTRALGLALVAAAAIVLVPSAARAEGSDIERARALDHEGARAFREGRYNDAIRYFEDAYRLGAPGAELWNIARCYLKLDQPEQANEALERYLATPDLPAADRTEARAQLAELHRRHSTLTITSRPLGAEAFVDGKPIGKVPTSADLTPGPHLVEVRRGRDIVYEERVTARFGRAIIVDAAPDDVPLPGASAPTRFTSTAQIGLLWGRLGSVGEPAHAAGLLGAAYVAHDRGRIALAVGLRASLTEDSWGNSVGAHATGCATPARFDAAALSAYVDGALGIRASSRVRVDADFGVGIAGYFAGSLGGDVFLSTCSPSPGVEPAMLVSGSVSYAFNRVVRAVVTPLWFELQPAEGGARTTPTDAAGAWLRIGGSVGVAIDL